jgi:hypothetical protein
MFLPHIEGGCKGSCLCDYRQRRGEVQEGYDFDQRNSDIQSKIEVENDTQDRLDGS